jgi:hypothetical protein
MSGYIGAIPTPQATQSRDVYTATSNQTTFTTQGYTPNFVSVYLNGVHLARADFTATNGSDVVLASGATADDVVEIISFGTFQSADALPLTGGTMTGDLIVPDGDLILGSTAVTSTAAELNQLDGVVAKTAGKETIWVPASAMQPTTSNGCSALTTVETTSGRPDLVVLDFDKDSDEFAQFSLAFPVSWNEGTVTFQFFWSGIAATTGVTLGLQGVAVGDNDTIDVVYGTAILVDDDAQGAVEEMLVSAESAAITIAGSPAVDQLCYFRIFRDVSATNDDMAGDCRLHGVKLFFTTDAANDG